MSAIILKLVSTKVFLNIYPPMRARRAIIGWWTILKPTLATYFFADVWPSYKMMGRWGGGVESIFPLASLMHWYSWELISLSNARGIVLELIFIFYERESVSKLFFYIHRYQANQGWFLLFTDAGIIVFKSIYSNSAKLWPKSLNARRKLQLHLIKSADWV